MNLKIFIEFTLLGVFLGGFIGGTDFKHYISAFHRKKGSKLKDARDPKKAKQHMVNGILIGLLIGVIVGLVLSFLVH
jgi:hypothetical protein